jgi:D-arabinose 1-dehydrogenase
MWFVRLTLGLPPRRHGDYCRNLTLSLTADLHDVEYVCAHPFPTPAGDHMSALAALTDPFHPDFFRLRPPYTPLGPGDERVLEGLRALSELRERGIVRKIGMAGYPLPVLLRLSLLARAQGITLDIVQTYAQHTILNPSLGDAYLPAFEAAGLGEITNAAPLAMGILTTAGGPEWHPARTANDGAYEACRHASALCEQKGTKLENVALDFGLRELKMQNGTPVPVVIGCKTIDEIRRTVHHWREVNIPGERSAQEAEKAQQVEQEIAEYFDKQGVRGLSWASPSDNAL